jgi:shikimate dehydrogenase
MGASNHTQMFFVGVSTKDSFVHRVFNSWASCLGTSMVLLPYDIPLASPDELYRMAVSKLRNGYPMLKGALITSHKASLFDAAADMFDELSEDAIRLSEIGMVYWSNNRLCGGANDVLSTSRVTTRMLVSASNWINGSHEVLIFGAGGAGVALANTLVTNRTLECKQVTLIEANSVRAKTVSGLVKTWQSPIPVTVLDNVISADALIQQSGQGSLIVNATGLGKDRPGSPISTNAVFPLRSFAWEFNYRFVSQDSPTFLEIARAQQDGRELTLEDGWDYFIWGWLRVMSRVVGIDASIDQYHACFRDALNSVKHS